MKLLTKISEMVSSNVGILVVIFAIMALKFPAGFIWAEDYTNILLGVVMFAMGMSINFKDFKTTLRKPQYLLLGCCTQFLIMPAVALGLIKIFDLSMGLAIGVILVGCCPGGTASNVITYIAKGDVSLSVCMTTTSTLLAPFFTPLLVFALGGKWIEVPLKEMIVTTLQVVLIPVLIGILLHEIFKEKIKKIAGIMPMFSVLAIIIIICAIIGKNSLQLMEYGFTVGAVVILHNLLGMTLGGIIAKLFRLDSRKMTAVAIEVGMQNSGLAVSLANTSFAMYPLAAVPGAVFSVWHNISGALFAMIMKKINVTREIDVNNESVFNKRNK